MTSQKVPAPGVRRGRVGVGLPPTPRQPIRFPSYLEWAGWGCRAVFSSVGHASNSETCQTSTDPVLNCQRLTGLHFFLGLNMTKALYSTEENFSWWPLGAPGVRPLTVGLRWLHARCGVYVWSTLPTMLHIASSVWDWSSSSKCVVWRGELYGGRARDWRETWVLRPVFSAKPKASARVSEPYLSSLSLRRYGT